MEEHKQAVMKARALRDEVARVVCNVLGLDKEEPPKFMGQVALGIARGEVLFDVDTQVTPEQAKMVAGAIKAADHPLIRAAGWLYADKDMMVALDELWVDVRSLHAIGMIESGLGLMLVVLPDVGMVGLRVDASDAYEAAGWPIVPKSDVSDEVRQGLFEQIVTDAQASV